MLQDIHRGFREPDATADADSLVRFLDAADDLPSVVTCRQHMIDLAGPRPGQRVLDVGCGTGRATRQIAPFVGPTGFVAGIDANPAFIAEARRRATTLDTPFAYEPGDARRLPFPPASFDVARTERVLMYIEEPAEVIDQLARVLGRGGTLVSFEFDYDNIVVDAPAPSRAITRRIVRAVADSVPSPWIGRQLPRLLRARGLREVTTMSHMIGTPFAVFRRVVEGAVVRASHADTIGVDDLERWWDALERADRAGDFFAGFFGFIVCGRLS